MLTINLYKIKIIKIEVPEQKIIHHMALEGHRII